VHNKQKFKNLEMKSFLTLLTFIIVRYDVSCAQASWPGSGPDICVVPSTFPVRPDTTCSDSMSSRSDCEALNVDLSFQRGESEDVQILIRKEPDLDDLKGGVENVSVSVTKTSDPVSVNFYRVLFVEAKRTPRYPGSGGGWRADPLYPITADTTFDVPSGVTQSIWVSFTVSRDAVPGKNITGEISVSSSKHSYTIPFTLHVSNVTLPTLAESKIGTAWSGSWGSSTFEPYYDETFDWNKTKDSWYDMMLNARMPPDSIYISKPRPIDDYVYLDKNGVQSFALLDVCSLPLDDGDDIMIDSAHRGRRLGSCANYTDDYVNRLIETLTPIVEELRSKDMLKHAYIYGFDENPVSCEPQVRKLFGATKKAFPDLRTEVSLYVSLYLSQTPTHLPTFNRYSSSFELESHAR